MKKILVIMAVLAVFVRLYKLDVSSHFSFDESRDLVNMHQIWVEKKLTLVGPIAEDRSHANSSLTYYMLLPFAAAFNFDPLGPAVGAVFWGLVTGSLLVWVVNKHNPRLVVLAGIVAAIWFPLVQTSRWAWNPNVLMVWFLVGLILDRYSNSWLKIASGLAFGLTVHHHNLALIPLGLWVLYKRDWRVVVGVFLALLPFGIFDLRHPPGIFITRMIGYNRDSFGQSPIKVLANVPGIFRYFYDYMFQTKILAVLGVAGSVVLAGWDILKKSEARKWLVIWTLSVIPLALYSKQFQYFFPAIPFFVMWLFTTREAMGNRVSQVILGGLIIGSVFSIGSLWSQPDWQGNLKIVRGGTKILADKIIEQKLKNPNLAVLASPDIYTSGMKFRNMLLVKNIRVRAYEEYEFSDNIFVVTTEDERALRNDPAVEMLNFRNGPVMGVWDIPETNWRVIQFNRY